MNLLLALLALLPSLGAEGCSSTEGPAPPRSEADAGQEAASDARAPGEPPGSEAGDGDAGLATGTTVLASTSMDLAGLAATESTVYFIARGRSAVHAVPLTGGAVTPFDADTGSPSSVAVSESDVIWADRGGLVRRSFAGGASTTVTPQPPTAASPIVTGSGRLVAIGVEAGKSAILEYRLDLSTGTSIAPLGSPYEVAVAAGAVYWTEPQAGTIQTAPIDTSSVAVLATSETGCAALAADSSGVYWTRPAEGLVRARLSGNGVTTLAASQQAPHSLVADESGVYWLTEDGRLRRSTRTELPLGTIAAGFGGAFTSPVHAIALTKQYVVWITNDGKVLRHDK